MTGRGLRVGLTAAFAVVVGHLAWETWFAPTAPFAPEIAGVFPALVYPDPSSRLLYLRKNLYLPQRPRAAWLRVAARDRFRLWVNGRLVDARTLDGFDVAGASDIAPFLAPGPNAIAIQSRQTRLRGRPTVSVEGAYTLTDGEYRIESDATWYCGRTFEFRGDWWFGKKFDEKLWPHAEVASAWFRARPGLPPESATTPDRGRWMMPPDGGRGSAAFRHTFTVSGRPETAWLRVTSVGACRLAVNGTVVDEADAELALQIPLPPARRVYDLTPFVRSGDNVVSLLVTAATGPPRAMIDGEVRTERGSVAVVASGKEWLYRPGTPPDWTDAVPANADEWRPCFSEQGDVGVPPAAPGRYELKTDLPAPDALRQAAGQVALMAVVGAAAWWACRRGAFFLGSGARSGVAFLALLPPTIAGAVAVLATFDSRGSPQGVYRTFNVLLLIAAVPLQWWLLNRLERERHAVAPTRGASGPPVRIDWWLVAVFAVVGFWLRAREVRTEPLMWDEVENYNVTLGFLKYGFPMFEVHPDLPPLVIHTSELQFVFHAAVALFTGDPVVVVRLPAVLFATATIPLVYAAGRAFFNRPTGLTAAALYALASVYAPMGSVGRYFSELQFFVLLTVVFAWKAVTAPSPGAVPRPWLWATVFGFLGIFFTWEGSALVAPGIAVAGMFACRGRLRAVLLDRHVFYVVGVVMLAYMAQRANHSFAQSRFLWFGVSLSDIRLMPMWKIQSFQPWYYLWESSWTQDALLPALGLLGGLMLAAGRRGKPFRFLLWVYLPAAIGMAFLLPNYQFRYIYHVSPMLLLIACGAVGRLAEGAVRLAGPRRMYGQVVAGTVLVAWVAVSCGLFLETRYLPRLRVDGVSVGLFKYPDMSGPARYVRDHMQLGDAVISNNVYQTNHLMGKYGEPTGPNDFIPVTGRLFLPATMPDHSSELIDRRDGSRIIAGPDDFRELLARYPRVWYIVQAGQHYNQNTPTISDLVSQQFDIVYEDYDVMVLFRGDSHRPAAVRHKMQLDLEEADAKFLD